MSAVFKYFAISLGLVFFIGFFGNLLLIGSSYQGTYNHDSLLSPLLDFYQDGINFGSLEVFGFTFVPEFNLSPFSWLPSSLNTFFYNYLSVFTFFPDFIALPLVFIISICFVLGLVTLVRGV
jgi:hypothetical protein